MQTIPCTVKLSPLLTYVSVKFELIIFGMAGCDNVPVKEIRDFTGALASKKAKKGIFITTSSFPKSVYEFVGQVEYKIILFDGERLANLMIDHSIGLSTVNTYHVKYA